MQARLARFTIPRIWPRPALGQPRPVEARSHEGAPRPAGRRRPRLALHRPALPGLGAPALAGLVACCLVLLPGLLAAEMIVRSYQARLTADAHARAMAGLDAAAALVETERTRAMNNAELAGSRLGPAVARGDSSDALVKAAADLRGPLRTSLVVLVDANGRTLAGDPASNLPFGSYWETKQGLQGKLVAVLQERAPGFAVEAAAPLRVDGEIVPGAAVVAQNLDDGFLTTSLRLTGLEMGLVQNGRLVAASRGIRRSFAYSTDQTIDADLLASGPDRFKLVRLGSESFFLAARGVMNGPKEIGTVLVGLPADAPADAMAWARALTYGGAIAGAALAVLLGARAGRWHQRRTAALASRVRAVGYDTGALAPSPAQPVRQPDAVWGALNLAIDDAAGAVQRRVSVQASRASHLESVLGSLADGIIVADEQHRVILTNPAARRLLSLPSDENGHAPAPDGPLDLLAGAAAAADPASPASSQRVIRGYSAPVLGDDDAPLGYVTVLHDATREQEVERLRSELLGVVSHELQTPLTAIKGALELVQDEDEGRLSRVQRRFLDTIDRNTARLIALVGDLLDLSRLDAGRLQLDLRPLDTPPLVQGCVSALSHLFEQRDQTVRVAVPDCIPPILGDRRRVEQIVTNLLSNAAKYTPDGGLIEVSATAAADHVVLVIADSGPGIPEPERELIFDRFYRGRDATRRGDAGSGLGLAIVRSLVELHGGTVRAEAPAPGSSLRGARLVVELPRARDDE